MSTYLDINKIEEELIVFFRNQDLITTTERNVTTITDTFNGDGNTKTFTLTQKTAKNVRVVSVGGVTKTRYVDYIVDYKDTDANAYPIVTFASAPGVGVSNVSVQYDYGSDKIFNDWPRVDLKIDSYPRIVVCVPDIRTEPLGLGGVATISDLLCDMQVFAVSVNKVEDIITKARDAITSNQRSFYYFKFITPVATTPMMKEPLRLDKIVTRRQTFMLHFVWESA